MGLVFEWDPAKAASNFEKHGVQFEDAMTVFNDESAISIYDLGHSIVENRFFELGSAKNGNVLCVCYTERDDRIRIIHARRANREERRFYEKI